MDIKFKGISSSTFPGLVVLQWGRRQKADKIYIDHGVLPGTSRALYEDTGEYKPYERTLEILLKDQSLLPSVFKWLDGSGELEIEEGGFYKARVLTSDEKREVREWDRHIVKFEVQPFFWINSGKTTETLTSAGTVNNPGTLPSKPYIKVVGSGNITLNIGANSYTLENVDEYIEIDSEGQRVYKNTVNQGKKLKGGFPLFELGSNNISWTGSVTRVEIIGKWKEL